MATKNDIEIEVPTINQGKITFLVVGVTPLICNRMSQKVLHELLLPKGKKTAADKASSLKHNPIDEFRSSPYTNGEPNSPTLIQHLSSAFKGAIKSAALDMPGANKSQIGRLTWVEGERIDIYGVPQLMMAVTRSADMNKTPDVRTRAVIPNWACRVTVSFVKPILREQSIVNLFAAAGVTQGIGDWRPGKGAGTYGQYRLVSEDDPEFLHIVSTGARAAQEAGMATPVPYDDESEEMLAWFEVEANRRGFKVVA
jgi:hypothetical protein